MSRTSSFRARYIPACTCARGRDRVRSPPPLPRTNRTSLVPPLVLSGHAASLTPSEEAAERSRGGASPPCAPA